MTLKNDVTCNICQKIVTDPVSLPCTCVICNHHTTSDTKVIRCMTCSEDFDVPDHGFRAHKLAKSILENEYYLDAGEKALKKSIQELISELEKLQAKFETQH